MADYARGFNILGALSQAGMQGQRPGLPGMVGRMPPEQLEMWREMMRQRALQERQMQLGAGQGMGFAGAGQQNMAPWLSMGAQNPGLAQFFMGMR